ncbi:MAG: helix-turn-helix transcriptional regulator [Amoebophilaceae bacterium]|nr:helix-turn-helix transcriptional regulator [Amoebophilaceae bacterium]
MKTKLNEIISQNIKQKRSELKLSQESLAEILNVHRNTIAFIERKKRNVSIDLLEKLAELFKCEPFELLKCNKK